MEKYHHVRLDWRVVNDAPVELEAIIVRYCEMGICAPQREALPCSWEPPLSLFRFTTNIGDERCL